MTQPIDALLAQLDGQPIETVSINTIRTLAMDAIQKANSGHPGAPMGLAPAAYVLWTQYLKHNPKDPSWFDRDRFVLSCGHASMLIYALLHLAGYELSLDEIKAFRQLGSLTPGHPEVGLTPGIETTTGPLGQGIATAVGMAMAEAHLAGAYNRPGHDIIDHYTYVFASDGDLMEGVSHEAASLAGHHKLGKLIVLYDDNKITIDGGTDLAYSEDARKRFESYGWQVIDLGDAGNDLDAISSGFAAARDASDRPTLLILQTHIGFGAPSKQDKSSAHGSPLGQDELRGAKRNYGWPEESAFLVPPRVQDHMDATEAGRGGQAEWNERFDAYRVAHPELAAALEGQIAGTPPAGWDQDIPAFAAADGAIATRAASGKVINGFAHRLPSLIGGSADLTGSTKTLMNDVAVFLPSSREGRNLYWGIREHGMAAACNGMALHGGLRPYGATFLVFTDYCRPAIRLSALMHQPVIYVMTHDSIGLGEDGPTHQPIEHLAALRSIPNLHVVRPAEAKETAEAWRHAIERTDGPTVLVLTRQKLPILEADASGALRGAYVLSEAANASPDLLLMATGSEVEIALAAQKGLAEKGVSARVVSMPCWEQFRAESADYREQVLPASVTKRLAIEAGCAMGWHEWVGFAGDVVAMTGFGASAPANELYEHFGFGVDAIIERALAL